MIKNLRKKFIKNVKVGSGLTVNLRNMMNESMSKDNGFVMIDGKGGMESLIEVLNTLNREKDIYVLDFTASKKSQSVKKEKFMAAQSEQAKLVRKIKTIFLIKDIITSKFFGTYRIDDYWTNDINDAKEFTNKDEALELIQDEERFGDFFSYKYLSIEEIIKVQ